MATGNKIIAARCEYIDPSIERISANKTHLSILHYGDGLCFSLLSEEQNKVVLLADYDLPGSPEALEEVMNQFTETFARYFIGFHSSTQSIVPSDLYHPEDLPLLSHNLLGTQLAEATQMLSINAVLLHNPVPDFLKTLIDRFPQAKLYPDSFCAVETLAAEWKHRPGQNIRVHVWDSYITITAFANGQLSMHNHFTTKNDEDRLYYILFAYEQLKQNPEEVPLKVSGTLVPESPLGLKLQEYIREVKPQELTGNFTFSSNIPGHAIHQYLPVFEAFTCV